MAKVDIEIKREFAELKERLQRLEHTLDALDDPGVPAWEKHLPAWWQESRRAARRQKAEAPSANNQPTITPPELQQRMIEHGVKPEDRVFNTTLAEMRGEKD